jgi:hypothetical protein
MEGIKKLFFLQIEGASIHVPVELTEHFDFEDVLKLLSEESNITKDNLLLSYQRKGVQLAISSGKDQIR